MDNSNNNSQEEIDFLDLYLKETLQNQPAPFLKRADKRNQFGIENKIQENIADSKFSFEPKKEAEININNAVQPLDALPGQENSTISISKDKIELINNLLQNIEADIKKIKDLLPSQNSDSNIDHSAKNLTPQKQINTQENKIIQGIFDGHEMIGKNDKEYSIATNYISKSKLVQGDKLKLTIKQDGTFIYKQTHQVERTSIISQLEITPEGKYFINNQRRKWRVLKASITYHQGTPGDQVIALIPKYGESTWAAVERIKNEE